MNRNLLLISLALTTWGLGEGMFMFFQPLYLQELGASPQQIGNILGSIGMVMTLAHLPAGYLADKLGRRPLLILAWFFGLSAAWVMALAKSLPMFIIGSAFYGFTSFVMAPMNSYITAARGKWSVGRAITMISATYNIGAFLGPLLGGFIGGMAGLRVNFLIAAVIFIISTGIILFIEPQPVEKLAPIPGQDQPEHMLNGRFVLFLILIFLAMFSMYLAQPLSQNFLQNQRSLDLMQIGQLLAARSAGIVLLNLILGQLNARVGFLLAQSAMALFTLLLWQSTGFAAFMLGYFMLGSYQTARALASAQGRALVQSSNMGLAYGMIEMTMASVSILAPPLAGWLYTNAPYTIYSTSLALICITLLTTTILSPLRTRQLL